jgi:magnesium chelatase family protein
MTASVCSSSVLGIEAEMITVEARISAGLNYFIVGLPDNAVRESMFRVESVIGSSGLQMPRRKIVVSMAPADVKKQGSVFDLPIALSILAASGQLSPEKLACGMFAGELSLEGRLRPVRGALSMAIRARQDGLKMLVLPEANAQEAAIVSDLEVYGLHSLTEVLEFLNGDLILAPAVHRTRETFDSRREQYGVDFADVRGQKEVKRAMEIAAAGGHNAILIGPPGSGKTMLARRLPTILPPLNLYEALEATRIHSVAGTLETPGLLATRPFRSPHHTCSDIALIGGGAHPQPGEISLAHNGVLFLDELTEFKRSVLEVLRQPLEDRQVLISRASFSASFPASFVLIAAMNPCPCGFFRHPDRKCSCSPNTVRAYVSKISGPLLDRIDLHIRVSPVAYGELAAVRVEEDSAAVRERVVGARKMQQDRLRGFPQLSCNAQLNTQMVRAFCGLGQTEQQVLEQAMEKHKLSARAYDRILKVARTIADLEGCMGIGLTHLAEAIGFRCLDQDYLAA